MTDDQQLLQLCYLSYRVIVEHRSRSDNAFPIIDSLQAYGSLSLLYVILLCLRSAYLCVLHQIKHFSDHRLHFPGIADYPWRSVFRAEGPPIASHNRVLTLIYSYLIFKNGLHKKCTLINMYKADWRNINKWNLIQILSVIYSLYFTHTRSSAYLWVVGGEILSMCVIIRTYINNV